MPESRDVRLVTVPESENGSKLDAVVGRLFVGMSRKTARQAILTGRVALNGKVVKIFARAVRAGDRLTVSAAGEGSPHRLPPPELTVLHQDRDVLVIAKPAHLLSERALGERGEHVLGVLAARGLGQGQLVHRLDAGTSGVMLVARTPAAAERLSDAFRQGEIEKAYLLLCVGAPGEGEFDGPLGRDPKHHRRQAVTANGKHARTRYRTLATGEGPRVSLVAARPVTGRTHQIRVHFSFAGHALLGDGMYGGPTRLGTTLFDRPLLHAHALSFPQPRTHVRLRFVLPPPPDFSAAARALGVLRSFDAWDPLW